MPIEDAPDRLDPSPAANAPDDGFLVASVVGGDEPALRKLMDRYDRLVRFAVFRAARQRCARDPEFLESVASATWAGFVQSLRKNPDRPRDSVRAYLSFIARNQTVSALRRDAGDPPILSLDAGEGLDLPDQLEEPAEMVANLEDLETLRACLAECDPDDRTLIGQLPAITERRWRDAAEALNLAESTLRSRWTRLLERLRARLTQKNPKALAPGGPDGDS